MRTDQNLHICWKVPDFEHVMLCGLLLRLAGMSLQKRCFAVWFLFCGLVTVVTLRSTDVAHTELFYIYYQPLLPVLTMLWLWGINVRYFERAGVRYDVCFSSKDQKYLLNSRQIFQVL